VAGLQGLEGSGMAGAGETLESPWIPLAIRAWRGHDKKEHLCPSELPPINTQQKPRGFTNYNQHNSALCSYAMGMTSFHANGYRSKITQALDCKAKSGI
jgi:hypothetical protein